MSRPTEYDPAGGSESPPPSFTLLGNDPLSPSLIDLWANCEQVLRGNTPEVVGARDLAARMRNELYLQRKREVRVLDVIPLGVLAEIVSKRAEAEAARERRRAQPIVAGESASAVAGGSPYMNGSVHEPGGGESEGSPQ